MPRKLDPIVTIIDLESTCWDEEIPEGEYQEITEIGLCTLDFRNFSIGEKRSILIKPSVSKVSKFCTDLTTITQDMLDQEGIPLEDAFTILKKEYKSKSRVWASWGDFDRKMFERECVAKGLKYPFGPRHINLKSLCSLLMGCNHEQGMPAAMEKLGLNLEGTHHRGHDDAYNIARIAQLVLGAGGVNIRRYMKDEALVEDTGKEH